MFPLLAVRHARVSGPGASKPGEGWSSRLNTPSGSKKVISHKLKAHSNFLAKLELYTMLFLSKFDMISDITMVVRYLMNEDDAFANATLICIGTSLKLQSINSYGLNKKLPWQAQLKGQILVWGLIKPGVDAYRVANHTKLMAGSSVDARHDMTA